MTHDHTLQWNGFSATFTYYPPSRGARDSLGGRRGCGPPLEPDEPASVEISEIIDLDSDQSIDPSDFSQIESLEEACLDYVANLHSKE